MIFVNKIYMRRNIILNRCCYFSIYQNKDNSAVYVKRQFKYYKPSQTINTLFSSKFDFRFQQIKNSLVTQSFFSKLNSICKWKTKYQNLSITTDLQQLNKTLPINKNPHFACASNKIKYTWIGHSTAVISIGGKTNILIDPVFSQRCSPFKSIGPQRYRQLPCEIHELPKIDIVLVSHDHYDHLDTQALSKLQNLFKPIFVAGLNSKNVFPSGCNLYQMDWTQTIQIIVNNQSFQITFVPACHWSRRGLFDLGKRLWGGFIIKTPKQKKIYYSGDTGYCGVFKQIYDVFGQIDFSILPIGVYQPRQYLKNQHTNPQQAVIIHKQLKSKKSVGVHWGTFPLSNQKYDAPKKQLLQSLKRHGLKVDEFLTINHGDSFQIDY